MKSLSEHADELALEHAWNWFNFHAAQRLTMIRFYLTVAGAIATGAGYSYLQHEYSLSGILCTLGTIASLCFMRLDKRVSDLVKIGERALATQEKIISQHLNTPAFEICKAADNNHKDGEKRPYAYPYTYRENFQALFLTSALAGC